MDHGVSPGFDTAVIAVDCFVHADLRIPEMPCFLLVGEGFDILAQGSLVALECEDVIGFLRDNRPCDDALAAHRVDAHHGPFDRHHLEQCWYGEYLVRLLVHFHLAECQTLPRRKGRNHVDRLL